MLKVKILFFISVNLLFLASCNACSFQKAPINFSDSIVIDTIYYSGYLQEKSIWIKLLVDKKGKTNCVISYDNYKTETLLVGQLSRLANEIGIAWEGKLEEVSNTKTIAYWNFYNSYDDDHELAGHRTDSIGNKKYFITGTKEKDDYIIPGAEEMKTCPIKNYDLHYFHKEKYSHVKILLLPSENFEPGNNKILPEGFPIHYAKYDLAEDDFKHVHGKVTRGDSVSIDNEVISIKELGGTLFEYKNNKTALLTNNTSIKRYYHNKGEFRISVGPGPVVYAYVEDVEKFGMRLESLDYWIIKKSEEGVKFYPRKIKNPETGAYECEKIPIRKEPNERSDTLLTQVPFGKAYLVVTGVIYPSDYNDDGWYKVQLKVYGSLAPKDITGYIPIADEKGLVLEFDKSTND